ncbi:hypothetical protein M9H77_11504 [Catharanthus roseus]|uniref:Uncharacterized protein n=1 Tax=Catharanthus roseus TaxID=4058 RepID=A0ACC0BET4_CATRO|nr:hypothetical protein M9H77_11504 [Catharanthus roseus]
MENEANGEDEKDLDSHGKTERIEFQSNYDYDYKLFFENMRLEGSNVIFQYKNGASVVYDGLIFLNSQTDDNLVSKKQKYTDAIQHETTMKGISYPFSLFWIKFFVNLMIKRSMKGLCRKSLCGSLNISIEIFAMEGKSQEVMVKRGKFRRNNF